MLSILSPYHGAPFNSIEWIRRNRLGVPRQSPVSFNSIEWILDEFAEVLLHVVDLALSIPLNGFSEPS